MDVHGLTITEANIMTDDNMIPHTVDDVCKPLTNLKKRARLYNNSSS